MQSLTIGLDFISGKCVATDVSNRDEPEWPPHPGRVFMAMAAACFETGERKSEVAALKWLESLPPPLIYASRSNLRSPVKYYVPVNDKVTSAKSLLQSAPGMPRSKQERNYPTAIPNNTVMKFVWQNASNVSTHIGPLSDVCANVIRVGHSSSLVSAWAEVGEPDGELERSSHRSLWRPVNGRSKLRVRIAGKGEFERLKVACNAEKIEQFGDLKFAIESTKGKKHREAKQIFASRFGEPFKVSLRPPESTPPVLGLWQGYTSEDAMEARVVEGEYFDSQLLIIRKVDRPNRDSRNLAIQDTLTLTTRLRDALMSKCENPIPEWLSGHALDGSPSRIPHVAFLALPFVGMEFADGHLMGLALALPKSVSPEKRGPVLGPLLFDDKGNPVEIELKLGRLGTWAVRLEERVAPPLSLQNRSWVGPSTEWASVTPVVLDRFPKAGRTHHRQPWEKEVRAIVAQSCVRAGLPKPLEIDIDTTSWHIGSARAYRKHRYPQRRKKNDKPSWLGDGFPHIPARSGKPSRPQIHIYLRFNCKLLGPVLIGAGRFAGYGLCKPLEQRR